MARKARKMQFVRRFDTGARMLLNGGVRYEEQSPDNPVLRAHSRRDVYDVRVAAQWRVFW